MKFIFAEMKNKLLCSAVGLVVLGILAHQSGATSPRDEDNMEEFDLEYLDYMDTVDDEDPEDDYHYPEPSVAAADRRKERASVNTPADTPTSKHNLHNERSTGRYCGELAGELFKAEVRAINKEWLLLRNLYWDNTLNHIAELGFKTTYKYNGGTLDSFIRVNPNVRDRSHEFMYYVRYAHRHIVDMDRLEVFNRDNMELLASLDVSDCVPPSRVLLGRLTQTSRGVASGDITLLSSNAMTIQDLVLPTDSFNMYLWAGFGRVHEKNGYIIPVDGSTDPIRIYNSKKMVVELPPNHTFYDVDYIAVFSYNANDSLGHVYLNRNAWRSNLLPPSWVETRDSFEHQAI